ncbi:MAG: hypothetical protein LBC03_00005 [Nitrososphaerota archaeon]|jgi:hypothetical protein|nr:hypothetical protein [Nitrososphaerota archaeon]
MTRPKEERQVFYQNARDEVGTNRETATSIQKGIYTPKLETLDNSPRFAIDAFNTGSVTDKGAIANAKIFAGIKKIGVQQNIRDSNLHAETEFYTATSDVLGERFSQASGVKMTPKEQKAYGCTMVKVRDTIDKQNPLLAKNLAHYIMGDKKDNFTRLMADEKFTTQAVKDMESQQTSAWLVNTLNVKQKDIPSLETLFKTEPNTTTNTIIDNTVIPNKNTTTPQTIPPKQLHNKPVELLDLQKRHYEENLNNAKNYQP